MGVITSMRRQWAVYWQKTGEPDDFGKYSFVAAVAIRCRWDDEVQEFRTVTGNSKMSKSIAYVDREISEGDYLAEIPGATKSDDAASALAKYTGDTADPLENEKAYKVEYFRKTPNFKATETLYTAMM